jgi:hypothetical protein
MSDYVGRQYASFVPPSPETRRAEALHLAEELLADIELGQTEPMAIARKTSRLARLLDDAEAMTWLNYEISGYPVGQLDAASWAAAKRSHRVTEGPSGPGATSTPLGKLTAELESAQADLGAGGSTTSDSVVVENRKADLRQGLRAVVAHRRELIDKVLGSLHQYVSGRYQELRFGSAVESAFEVVRGNVDAAINDLVPGGLGMIAAAFENATSDNPEHWQSAASTCRRLLMTAADQLSARTRCRGAQDGRIQLRQPLG